MTPQDAAELKPVNCENILTEKDALDCVHSLRELGDRSQRTQVMENFSKLLRHVQASSAELKRLKDALPVTADGVTLVPEMLVVHRMGGLVADLHVAAVYSGSVLLYKQGGAVQVPIGPYPASQIYSTESAARAATNPGGQR